VPGRRVKKRLKIGGKNGDRKVAGQWGDDKSAGSHSVDRDLEQICG
jgi:hypothetical protein